jgi:hypothetical protein
MNFSGLFFWMNSIIHFIYKKKNLYFAYQLLALLAPTPSPVFMLRVQPPSPFLSKKAKKRLKKKKKNDLKFH